MTGFIEINGEQISTHESEELLRMMCNDAKKIAGEFHGMNRSAKFRVNWPDEYKFANSEWRNFIEAVHEMYATALGDPKVSEVNKRRMFLAIVLWKKIGEVTPKDNRLQLSPNTQQFEGDPFENKKIVENYTKAPNLRAALLNSTATRH